MKLRTLSIRQPEAALIAVGWKGVENRTWATKYRGLLAIHAGKKKMTKADWAWFCDSGFTADDCVGR